MIGTILSNIICLLYVSVGQLGKMAMYDSAVW